MVALSDDLNLLAGALEHEYSAMKQALAELSDRRRAQTAYIKAQKDD